MTIPSINNTNFSDTVRGLTEALKDTGLDLLLGYTNYDIEEEERLVKSFLRRRPEAIVVTGGNHTERCRKFLSASGVPVIETWDLPSDPIDSIVGFSNAQSAGLVAKHFADQGHTKIGFIGGHTQRDTRGFDRRAGFIKALGDLGLDTSRVADTGPPPTSMSAAATALNDLLERHPDTQAVMCVSDPAAFGAMMECKRRGLSVPGDLAIAGFGADDISINSVPTITTVEVGPFEIGVKAGEIIIQTLSDDLPTNSSQTIETMSKLLIRDSG